MFLHRTGENCSAQREKTGVVICASLALVLVVSAYNCEENTLLCDDGGPSLADNCTDEEHRIKMASTLADSLVKKYGKPSVYDGPLPKECEKLIKLRPESIPIVIDLLKDKSAHVRIFAEMSLSHITGIESGDYELHSRWWRQHKHLSRLEWLKEGACTGKPYDPELCLCLIACSGEKESLDVLIGFLSYDKKLEFPSPFVGKGKVKAKRICDLSLRLLQNITAEFLEVGPADLHRERHALIEKWQDWLDKNRGKLRWRRREEIFYRDRFDLKRRLANFERDSRGRVFQRVCPLRPIPIFNLVWVDFGKGG